MFVEVLIPSPLRKLTGGVAEVRAAGGSVRELLDNLTAEHQGLRERLFDDDGRIRRFINLYVNEKDIRHLDGLDTPVADGDRVSIVPAIAGG